MQKKKQKPSDFHGIPMDIRPSAFGRGCSVAVLRAVHTFALDAGGWMSITELSERTGICRASVSDAMQVGERNGLFRAYRFGHAETRVRFMALPYTPPRPREAGEPALMPAGMVRCSSVFSLGASA